MDRNICSRIFALTYIWSLSARRAWIEITFAGAVNPLACVALRKESVDRNLLSRHLGSIPKLSLSARRAWIEIAGTMGKSNRAINVALRKESVDRNKL